MKEVKEKLNIGIIGVGHMGQYHVNVVASMLNYNLVGIYDENIQLAQEIANKFEIKAYLNLDDLLKDCESVTIAVPTVLHYETAKRALLANCHVLVEKPITETVEQATELCDIAKKHNKILQVGHVERFNGAVIELKKIVTNPLLIEAKRLAPFSSRIKDVGVILDMLIHDLDIVLNLVDSPLKKSFAVGSKVETNNEDIAQITLVFENGCIATITGSRVSQKKERSLMIQQDKSYIYLNYSNQDIEIHRQASSAYLMTKEQIRYSQESFVENLFVHKDNPLKSEHQHFFDCIRNGVEPLVPNDKDIETLSIALSSLKEIAENFSN